jgi:hypothetical protein
MSVDGRRVRNFVGNAARHMNALNGIDVLDQGGDANFRVCSDWSPTVMIGFNVGWRYVRPRLKGAAVRDLPAAPGYRFGPTMGADDCGKRAIRYRYLEYRFA